MRKIILIIAIFFSSTILINAQDLIKLTMGVCHSTANTFDFDLIIRNDGAQSMILQAFQFGIDYDYSGIGGGNLQIQMVDNSSQFPNNVINIDNLTSVPYSSLGNPRINTNNGTNHQIQIVSNSTNCTAGTPMASNTDYRLGTFRVTNPSFNFTANSHPNLSFNNGLGINGIKQTVIQEYYNGACGNNVTQWSTNCASNVVCTPIPEVYATPCTNSGLILNRTCTIPTTPVNAGIGQVLTITPMSGQSFGGSRGTGNIEFFNADDPEGDRVSLDAFDWTNPVNLPAVWSNTQIQVSVPSIVTISTTPPPTVYGTPGSGFIKVKDNAGNEFTSTTPLMINSAIKAFGNLKQRTLLARYQCINGYTFYLGTNISYNSPMGMAIEAACNEWSDKLDIDVKLSSIPQPPETNLNNYCVISY